MTAKTVNYTAEQTVEIVTAYQAGETVEALAERFQKSVRSIVAKLSREGVYKKKEYTTKNGEKVVKKDAHAVLKKQDAQRLSRMASVKAAVNAGIEILKT